MISKDSAYQKISDLVLRFEEQFISYKNPDYNETLTRRDFIDPFFKALGWDIDNEDGYAEAYREVIHEDKVKVGSATKAPDYSFRLVGGKRLFFVEAKKPSIVIKDDILPAYQVRRYGWSAKLAISIITDFEEFSVYDCTKKPIPTDKASVARIKYLTFKDYLTEFDFIWDTFSKERVLKGSFDKYIQSDTNKKGTTTVDKEFLQSLDKWRTYLATSISLRNKNLNEDEINFAVQQFIDRIIFLRIAEDRGVEVYGNLKYAIKQGDYYKNLFELYKKADEKYNSGLFDFKKDQISKNLLIDNKVIKSIITELYYPECPYEFSVLAVEILGSAYEQFLGKVIRITKAHHAIIEEKPEVRKAGGVYYTPQYIVEYIVNNTVGKLVDGKTPKEVSNIKIVDPACGSGSFLIGAYQYLLDWHKHYYTNNGKPTKGKKDSPLTPEGALTTGEKKRILLNNIHGVDIDVNAVEVTKLSLLLKCMEGETQASIGYQLSMFNERVLPTLDNNIKDGNSLIDLDFYSGQLDLGFEKKIKPFNWQKAFPEVFKETKTEEERELFHVTCVMHNTRTSQRMVDFNVKTGQAEYLSVEEECELIKIIAGIVKGDRLRILSLNLCADHLHFVIACNSEKLTGIVGKLKSVSAREFNVWRGITKPQEFAPEILTMGHAPLSSLDPGQTPEKTRTRGDTQNSLWAQKFNRKLIDTNDQLNNTLDYIENNRIKHNLPPFPPDISELILSILTPYEKAFEPEIVKGGFDAVIGNPPYGAIFNDAEKDYLLKKFNNQNYQLDSYLIFLEQSFKIILKTQGRFGMIIPNPWLTNLLQKKLRMFIFENTCVNEIVHFKQAVFPKVTVDTEIIILTNHQVPNNIAKIIVVEKGKSLLHDVHTVITHRQREWIDSKGDVVNIFQSEIDKVLFNEILKESKPLEVYFDINVGIKPYQVGKGKPAQTRKNLEDRTFDSDSKENELFRKYLRGSDINRYKTVPLKERYLKFGKWLAEPRPAANFAADVKIFMRQTGDSLIGTLDTKQYLCLNNMHVLVPKANTIPDGKYFLGIINSKLLNWFYQTINPEKGEALAEVKKSNVAQLPIKIADAILQTELVKLVDQLLKLNEEKSQTKLQTQISQIENKIDYCENRINEIVYHLYGLTEEEITIVENSTK
jgi:type I restriction-modification system DNA methylase subunit/REP element-mobilizing transposase RayT